VTNARGVAVGSSFTLKLHPREDQNREHLVTAATYEMEYSDCEALTGDTGAQYRCYFVAMANRQQFRPRRATPKPFVQGPQTAVVVGPAGEEIYTDELGRVKVQFHWDRYGQKDEQSSCWTRVSHPWAGKGWGAIHIPRIGQEVVVDFLEGDPDQPIITGRVYNAEQTPPYDLPAHKTRSGVKSRSSLGGSPDHFNEIRFEDEKGNEQLFIHAERNHDIEVEANETHSVGGDRTKTVGNNETVKIGGDRKEDVGGNETITIGGVREHIVLGNEHLVTGSARQTESQAEYRLVARHLLDSCGGLARQQAFEIEMRAMSTIDMFAGFTIEMLSGATIEMQASLIEMLATQFTVHAPSQICFNTSTFVVKGSTTVFT
jgi:type VI secretion system secreted protein VgrG